MQNNFQDTTQDRDRLESRHTIQTPENLKRPASASAIPSENDDFDTEYTDIPVPNAQSPPPTPTTVTTQEPLVTYSNSTPDDNANNLLDELSWDTGAKVFWHSYFGNSTVVTWEKFITALELRLSLQPADKRNLKKIIGMEYSRTFALVLLISPWIRSKQFTTNIHSNVCPIFALQWSIRNLHFQAE